MTLAYKRIFIFKICVLFPRLQSSILIISSRSLSFSFNIVTRHLNNGSRHWTLQQQCKNSWVKYHRNQEKLSNLALLSWAGRRIYVRKINYQQYWPLAPSDMANHKIIQVLRWHLPYNNPNQMLVIPCNNNLFYKYQMKS